MEIQYMTNYIMGDFKIINLNILKLLYNRSELLIMLKIFTAWQRKLTGFIYFITFYY